MIKPTHHKYEDENIYNNTEGLSYKFKNKFKYKHNNSLDSDFQIHNQNLIIKGLIIYSSQFTSMSIKDKQNLQIIQLHIQTTAKLVNTQNVNLYYPQSI